MFHAKLPKKIFLHIAQIVRVQGYTKNTIHYNLCREICFYSCVSMCDAIAVAEIIRFAWNLAETFMCYAKLAIFFV